MSTPVAGADHVALSVQGGAAQKKILAVGTAVQDAMAPLADSGWLALHVQTGEQGLFRLLNEEFAAVVVSSSLPDMAAACFLREARKIWPWMALLVWRDAGRPAVPDVDAAGVLQVAGALACDAWLRAVEKAWRHGEQAANQNAVFSVSSQIRQLRAFGEASHFVLNDTTVEESFAHMALILRRAFGADVVGVLFNSGAQAGCTIQSGAGLPDACVSRLACVLNGGYGELTGRVIEKTVVPDVRVAGEGGAQALDVPGPLMTAPLFMAEKIYGVMVLTTAQRVPFSLTEQAIFCHSANQLVASYQVFQQSRRMATRDPLTGLYNRWMLDEAVQQTWMLCRRNGQPLSMIVMDVDDFKTLNDQYGHLTGDTILREVAALIRDAIRSSDIAARFGGDEFVIILPATEREAVRVVANRILVTLRSSVFGGDANCNLTVSMGVATVRPELAEAYHSPMQMADQALYAAKRNGKNNVCEWGLAAADTKIQEVGAEENAGMAVAVPPGVAGRVLVIDDEAGIRTVLSSMLSWLNYEVSTCGSLAEARALLNERKNWFDVVLTDMHIGNDTGLEILAMLKRSDPSPVRIVITGFATKDMTVACLREGAFDFIEKPFTSTILTTTLNRAMMHRRLIQENWRYQERLEELVRLRSQNLTTALEQLRNSYAQTIRALATMIDLRETGTGQHCFAVGAAIRVMAQMMGVPAHDREVMEMGAALHDIGKIGIPDSILLKPSSLSDDDWVVMRSHSEIGFNLLSGVPFLQEVAQMVHSHHERFDGRGYPRGLKGEQIPLGSRLFAVIDSYHAMRSDRSYRKALPVEAAVAEIDKNAGAQFDPEVVATFMKCRAEIEAVFTESKPGG